MQPAGVDAWGNVVTWSQTATGDRLMCQEVHPRELPWRLPMLMSAVRLWRIEQGQAIRRFAPDREGKSRTH